MNEKQRGRPRNPPKQSHGRPALAEKAKKASSTSKNLGKVTKTRKQQGVRTPQPNQAKQKKAANTPILPAKIFPGSDASLEISFYNENDEEDVMEFVHDSQFFSGNMKGLPREGQRERVFKRNINTEKEERKENYDVDTTIEKLQDEDDGLLFGVRLRSMDGIKAEENGVSGHVEEKDVLVKEESTAEAKEWERMSRDSKAEHFVKWMVEEKTIYAYNGDEGAEFEKVVHDQVRTEIVERKSYAAQKNSEQRKLTLNGILESILTFVNRPWEE